MAETATPTEEQLETAQRLRGAIGRLSRLLRPTDAGSRADLTPTGVGILLTTDNHGPIRLATVGEREGLNPTMLSRTLATLVASGLIERTPDPDDRRSAWISATAHGREVAERIRRERTDAVLKALDRLPSSQQQAIVSALPALARLADQMAEER